MLAADSADIGVPDVPDACTGNAAASGERVFVLDDVAVDPVQGPVQDLIEVDEAFPFEPSDFDCFDAWQVDACPVAYESADVGLIGDDSDWWQGASWSGCVLISSTIDWEFSGSSLQAWPFDPPVVDTFLAVDGAIALTLVGQPDWFDTSGWTVRYLYEGQPVEVAGSEFAMMDAAVSGGEPVTFAAEATAAVLEEPADVEMAAPSAPAATTAADTARLYAAFAAGIGPAGTDGQSSLPIGSRRGPRR